MRSARRGVRKRCAVCPVPVTPSIIIIIIIIIIRCRKAENPFSSVKFTENRPFKRHCLTGSCDFLRFFCREMRIREEYSSRVEIEVQMNPT